MRETNDDVSTAVSNKADKIDKVLIDLKEDIDVALSFVTVLKRKLETIHNAVHASGDAEEVGEELTRKLEMIGTIAKKDVKMRKVTEYHFVKDNG